MAVVTTEKFCSLESGDGYIVGWTTDYVLLCLATRFVCLAAMFFTKLNTTGRPCKKEWQQYIAAITGQKIFCWMNVVTCFLS